jgi:site-specific recombinase XerD
MATYPEMLDDYKKFLKNQKNLSDKTILNYSLDCERFFKYLEASYITELVHIDVMVMREYLSVLYEAGYARSSIARHLSCLRSLFRYLCQQRIVETNPLLLLHAPKKVSRLPQFLYRQEVEQLLDEPGGRITSRGGCSQGASPGMAESVLSQHFNRWLAIRDRAILELFYSSGLRIGEAVQINIEDLDLEMRSMIVKGKGRKERMAPIGRPAAAALVAYLKVARPALAKSPPDRGAPLFVNWRGQRLSTRGLYGIIVKYLQQLGLGRNLTPHALRHTFATHLLDGGADLRSVQELLGHARMSSTQIYTHVSGERIRKVYEAAHPRSKLGVRDSPTEGRH